MERSSDLKKCTKKIAFSRATGVKINIQVIACNMVLTLTAKMMLRGLGAKVKMTAFENAVQM